MSLSDQTFADRPDDRQRTPAGGTPAIVARPGADRAAVDGIVAQVTADLADAGQLDDAVIADDIPRNGSGKIDYPGVVSAINEQS